MTAAQNFAEKMRAAAREKTPPPPASAAPSPEVAPEAQLMDGAPAPERGDVLLRVHRLLPNRHRLLARVVTAGELGALVFVQVRDNQRYRPGLAITGRQVGGNVYEVIGQQKTTRG